MRMEIFPTSRLQAMNGSSLMMLNSKEDTAAPGMMTLVSTK